MIEFVIWFVMIVLVCFDMYFNFKAAQQSSGIRVLFKKTVTTARLPEQAHKTDAGFDFFAAEEVVIPAHSQAAVDLGIAWEPDTHCYLQLKSRSGLAFKHGLETGNAGVIDETYRGSIKVLIYNHTDSNYSVKPGDKITQGIVIRLPEVTYKEAAVLADSERGTKGFGSSGK